MHLEEQEFFTFLASQLPAYLTEAEAWLHITQTDRLPYAVPLQDAVRHQLQRRGLPSTILDSRRGVLRAEEAGACPTSLLFYIHYNAETDDASALLPFLASLAMCDLYRTLHRPLPINIQWLIDGSGHDKFFPDPTANPSLAADHILWLTAPQTTTSGPLLALGVKGYLSVSLCVETATSPLASSYGSIVPNAAWRLLWALNSLKDAHEDILIEGFYDTLVPAHDQSLEALYTLPASLPSYTDQAPLPPFLLQLRGFQLHYAHLLLPTCSIINFASQTLHHPTGQHPSAPALLPEQAHAQVDFYLVPAQDPEDIFVKLQQHLQQQGFSDIVLQQRAASHPSILAPTHPFVSCLQQIIDQTSGRTPGILPMSTENFPLANTSQVPPLLVYTMDRLTSAKEHDRIDEASYTNVIKQLFLLVESLGKEKKARRKP